MEAYFSCTRVAGPREERFPIAPAQQPPTHIVPSPCASTLRTVGSMPLSLPNLPGMACAQTSRPARTRPARARLLLALLLPKAMKPRQIQRQSMHPPCRAANHPGHIGRCAAQRPRQMRGTLGCQPLQGSERANVCGGAEEQVSTNY